MTELYELEIELISENVFQRVVMKNNDNKKSSRLRVAKTGKVRLIQGGSVVFLGNVPNCSILNEKSIITINAKENQILWCTMKRRKLEKRYV